MYWLHIARAIDRVTLHRDRCSEVPSGVSSSDYWQGGWFDYPDKERALAAMRLVDGPAGAVVEVQLDEERGVRAPRHATDQFQFGVDEQIEPVAVVHVFAVGRAALGRHLVEVGRVAIGCVLARHVAVGRIS